MIVHPSADEDSDPQQGKILVGCVRCELFCKGKKPLGVSDQSFAWASGVGCHGRKKKSLLEHITSGLHLASSTNVEAETQAADMPSYVDESKSSKKDTMVKLFRIIYYLAKTNRPLSDYVALRELHVRNGLEEMDLDKLLIIREDSVFIQMLEG